MDDTEDIFRACLSSLRISLPPTRYNTGSFDQYTGHSGAVLRVKAIRIAYLLCTPRQGCGCPHCKVPAPAIICYMCQNYCDGAYAAAVAGERYPLCYGCFQRLHNND